MYYFIYSLADNFSAFSGSNVIPIYNIIKYHLYH
jgi:hypothetical protein